MSYIYGISSLRVNTSTHSSGRKQVKGYISFQRLMVKVVQIVVLYIVMSLSSCT